MPILLNSSAVYVRGSSHLQHVMCTGHQSCSWFIEINLQFMQFSCVFSLLMLHKGIQVCSYSAKIKKQKKTLLTLRTIAIYLFIDLIVALCLTLLRLWIHINSHKSQIQKSGSLIVTVTSKHMPQQCPEGSVLGTSIQEKHMRLL